MPSRLATVRWRKRESRKARQHHRPLPDENSPWSAHNCPEDASRCAIADLRRQRAPEDQGAVTLSPLQSSPFPSGDFWGDIPILKVKCRVVSYLGRQMKGKLVSRVARPPFLRTGQSFFGCACTTYFTFVVYGSLHDINDSTFSR